MAKTKSEILDALGRRYKLKVTGPKAKAADNYEAAKSGMKSTFRGTPFNSRIKDAYEAAIDEADYDPKDWWAERLVKRYEDKMF